jgi:hypothetical protein
MCFVMNWLIPFLVGVFCGQEFKDLPLIKPYVTYSFNKITEYVNTVQDSSIVLPPEK